MSILGVYYKYIYIIFIYFNNVYFILKHILIICIYYILKYILIICIYSILKYILIIYILYLYRLKYFNKKLCSNGSLATK